MKKELIGSVYVSEKNQKIWKWLKTEAARRGVSRSVLVFQIIERYMNRSQK